ncbi:MAG: FMN-binding protein [Kiritimatiellaeota bacterium]|nr:FMN-binding protein [Kiritimatiellota bacterium]
MKGFRDSTAYPVVYSACLGLVCALLLTVVGGFTRPYREANAKAEEMRRVLEVLEVPFPADASAAKLVEVFKANVRVEKDEARGTTRYAYVPSGARTPEAVALAFSGQGLWGPIDGLIALEADDDTVRGIAFTHQEETPGLGGEIASEWFRNQFRGKKIRDASGKIGIRIARGRTAKGAPTEVDGITGATLTCGKLEFMLNRALRRVFDSSRSN